MNKTLQMTIKFSPAICAAFTAEMDQCAELSAKNKTLKKVFKSVDSRAKSIGRLCYSGVTALGQNRVEGCVLEVANKFSKPPSSEVSEEGKMMNCMQQFQCFFSPNEKRNNPWNVTVPDTAMIPIMKNARTNLYTSESVGFKSLIRKLFEQAYETSASAKNMLSIFAGIVAGVVSLLLVELAIPTMFAAFVTAATLGIVKSGVELVWIAAEITGELLYQFKFVLPVEKDKYLVGNMNIMR